MEGQVCLRQMYQLSLSTVINCSIATALNDPREFGAQNIGLE